MAKKKPVYRVVFQSAGQQYELYARRVSHGELYGFVEVAEITFGERSSILVDPSDEKLKREFAGVKKTFVPIHAVVRIDEVEREGPAKVVALGDGGAGKSGAPAGSGVVHTLPLPPGGPPTKD